MTTADSPEDINVRASAYFIARTRSRCRECRKATPLIAFVLPRGHETFELDADAESDESAHDTWQPASRGAVLFYVGYLPRPIRARLAESAPFFRYADSTATLSAYWANHCEHCSALIADHELFCEPDGAFMPTSATAAAAISLVRVAEPFEAAADGYACDPAFIGELAGI